MRYTITERRIAKGEFGYFVNIDMDDLRHGSGMRYGWINDLGKEYNNGRYTSSVEDCDGFCMSFNSKKEAKIAVYADIHNRLIMDGFMVTELVNNLNN